ncbi:hypothetical protein [Aquisphaera insulae]|uniref:hypothetical protein n=1 Tax=Aquisphaera insulae TaxID=2712864 RepID=UPI0013ECF731|nr:hypothetical protein [Aquisphaera insulae]
MMLSLRAAIRRFLVVAVALAGVSATVRSTHADSILWYNGDFNESNALNNGLYSSSLYSLVYEDFIIPVGQTWLIQGVFSNNLMTTTTSTSAYWEIRSGVSSGDGGTLIASGTNDATLAATGRSGFGLDEYLVSVTGLGISLTSGTYWLTVAPVVEDNPVSFITTTSGANSIGAPPGDDDNSYLTSTFDSIYFDPAQNYVGYPADFSMGVTGVALAIPEPSALVSASIGAVFLGSFAVRRRRP